MFRVRDRYRLLALVLGASLVAQSALSVCVLLRARKLVAGTASECASLRAASAADLSSACEALERVREVASSLPTASAPAQSNAEAPAAPTVHVRGTGSNGRFYYADIVTDRHDGEPPEVRRIYTRIPDQYRPARFRRGADGGEGGDAPR